MSVGVVASSYVEATSGVPVTSGLRLWLAADRITGLADGDQIITWSDLSGLGNHATGAGASGKPTYRTAQTPKGGPAVLTSPAAGDKRYFTFGNLMSGATAGEAFLVVKANSDPAPSSSGNSNGLWHFSSNTNGAHYPYNNGSVYDHFGSDTRRTTVNPSPSLAAWRRYNVTSKAGSWVSRLDGSQIFSATSNTVAWGTTSLLGASPGTAAEYGVFWFAELIIYGRELTATERADVDTYLLRHF